MTDFNLERLNKLRKAARNVPLVTAVVEIAAFIMIVTGVRAPGLIIGLIALIGGSMLKRRYKKEFTAECARIQSLTALEMQNATYVAQHRETAEWLHGTRLVPSSTQVMQSPLVLNLIEGRKGAVQLWMGEVTFGVMEAGKKQPTWNSGTMLRTTLEAPVAQPMLLLGRQAFRHVPLRDAYAQDGMHLCAVGGKDTGWYALTEDASDPSPAVLAIWKRLCAATKEQAVVSVHGNELTAFFLGGFFTDSYPLDAQITEESLKSLHFEGYKPTLDLIACLNKENRKRAAE